MLHGVRQDSREPPVFTMLRFWNLTGASASAKAEGYGPPSPANSTPRILKSVFQTPADSPLRGTDRSISADTRLSDHPSSIIEALSETSTPIRATTTQSSELSEPTEHALPLPPPMPTALDVITPMEPLPPGTPGGPKDALRRGILRDLGTPGSGRSGE